MTPIKNVTFLLIIYSVYIPFCVCNVQFPFNTLSQFMRHKHKYRHQMSCVLGIFIIVRLLKCSNYITNFIRTNSKIIVKSYLLVNKKDFP